MAVNRVELLQEPAAGPLDIGLVTETFAPEVNGVALTLTGLVDELASQGHRITVVRPRRADGDCPARENVRLVAVPGAPLPTYPELRFGLPASGQLRQLWAEARPDVVYVATEGPLGWAAVRVARDLRIPVVSGFHTRFDSYVGHYHLRFAGNWVGRYLRRFHNNTLATIVPTTELQQTLAADGYRNVHVVRRAVNTGLFHPSKRDPALRESWGADARTPVVVWVGRIAREKNLELSVRAYEAFRAECPNARMVWVGDGPAKVTLQRREPGHVFAGMRHGEDLARHFASGDVFFFASESETYGNVVLEALASGVAVVAYDYGAAHEFINPGTDGYLAPRDDDRRFLSWAAYLGRFPEARKRLQRNAPRTVAGSSPSATAREFAHLLSHHRGVRAS